MMVDEFVKNERENFVLNAFSHFKPVKGLQCRRDVGELRSSADCTCQPARQFWIDCMRSI